MVTSLSLLGLEKQKISVLPIIAVFMFLLSGCANWNFANYEGREADPVLQQQIPVSVVTNQTFNQRNPSKVRFNVSVTPDLNVGFEEVVHRELESQGFVASDTGISLQFTLREMIFGSDAFRPFIEINVQGFDGDNQIRFNQSYKADTDRLLGNARSQDAVTSIYAEDRAWSALGYTFKQLFEDSDFWEFIHRNYEEIDVPQRDITREERPLVLLHLWDQSLEQSTRNELKSAYSEEVALAGFSISELNVTDEQSNQIRNCSDLSCINGTVNLPNGNYLIVNQWDRDGTSTTISSSYYDLQSDYVIGEYQESVSSVRQIYANQIPSSISEFVDQISDPSFVPGAAAQDQPREQDVQLFRQGGGLGLNVEQDMSREKEIRDAWAKRGGSLLGRSYGLNFNFLSFESKTKDSPLSTTTMFNGQGIGIKGGTFLVNFNPPRYENGLLSNYSASKIGVEGEFGYTKTRFWSRTSGFIENQFINEQIEDDSYQTQFNIVGNLGYFFGIGTDVISPLGWRGWEIGANWRPTLMIVNPENGDPETDFNIKGFSVDFAIGRELSTSLEKIAPEPYRILSLFFLPPINDDMPFFFSLSIKTLIY